MYKSDGKTVLITGASGLLGRSYVWYYLEHGWNVFGVDRREVPQPVPLTHTYSTYRHIRQDLRAPDAVKSLPLHVDMLINCAGINRETDDDDAAVIDIDLRVPLVLAKHYAKREVETVVNICSVAAFTDARKYCTYTSCKIALVRATQILSREYPFTRWLAVCPGALLGGTMGDVGPEYKTVRPDRVVKDTVRALNGRKVVIISGTHAKILAALHMRPGGKSVLRFYTWLRDGFR